MKILNVIPGKIYSGRLVVEFYNVDDREQIEAIMEKIRAFNDQLIKESEIEKIILNEIEEKKYAPFIIKALKYAYDFQSVELSDLVKNKIILNQFNSIWEFKKYFYKWVQKNFKGYIPLGAREKILISFSRSLGLSLGTVEKILDPGVQKTIKLKIKKSLSASDIIGLINYNIILRIFSFAKEIKVSMKSKNMGTLVKDIIYRSKKMGVYTEIKVSNHNMRLYIEGPIQITSPSLPSNFGSRVAYVTLPALSKAEDWELITVLDNDGEDALFKLRSSSSWVPHIKYPWEIDESNTPKAVFDSELEKKIYQKLSKIFGEIKREKDVLISRDGSIFIPDFTVKVGEEAKKIYIEVVGFWTENYIRKKIEKLNKLWKDGLRNIILLVDEKLMERFHSEHPMVVIKKDGSFSERELEKKVDLIIG